MTLSRAAQTREGHFPCACLSVYTHVLSVNRRTTPYDVHNTGPCWLVFDALSWPYISGVDSDWTNWAEPRFHIPHPETIESLVGLAPTFPLPAIIINHIKFVSATLSVSSYITQHWEKPSWQQQPESEPQCMITFPTLVPNCKLILSLFLVQACEKKPLWASAGLEWTNMPHQLSRHMHFAYSNVS